MNKHKIGKRSLYFRLQRRRLLQAMLGMLGGIALPIRAKRNKESKLVMPREAEFYRPKQETGKQ